MHDANSRSPKGRTHQPLLRRYFLRPAILLLACGGVPFAAGGSNVAEAELLPQVNILSNSTYGGSVALSGDQALVGAFRYDHFKGAAYLYTKRDGRWQDLPVTLDRPDPATDTDFGFGSSVAIGPTNLFVGIEGYDLPKKWSAGAVAVYSQSGGTWVRNAPLLAAPDATTGGNFGRSMAVDGDTLVVGAVDAAYLFASVGGVWIKKLKLSPDTPYVSGFGMAVAVSGDWALVGSRAEEVDGLSAAGAAYFYKRDNGVWQQTPLKISGTQYQQNFGSSVAISGDWAIIGATGASPNGVAYFLKHSLDGTLHDQWTTESTHSDAGGRAGLAVSLNGSTALIGAIAIHGSVDVMRETNGSWVYDRTLVQAVTEDWDGFGKATLAISQDDALVAADTHDVGGTLNVGAVYRFDPNAPLGDPPPPPPPPGPTGPIFTWPVSGAVSTSFEASTTGEGNSPGWSAGGHYYDAEDRLHYFKTGAQSIHRAIDIDVDHKEVHASAAGRVYVEPYSKSYGHNILIDHHNGYATFYAHLDQPAISGGDVVARQPIGISGSTGERASGQPLKPHLHFEIRRFPQRRVSGEPDTFYAPWAVYIPGSELDLVEDGKAIERNFPSFGDLDINDVHLAGDDGGGGSVVAAVWTQSLTAGATGEWAFPLIAPREAVSIRVKGKKGSAIAKRNPDGAEVPLRMGKWNRVDSPDPGEWSVSVDRAIDSGKKDLLPYRIEVK